MNYDFIRFATLQVYQECNIQSFPINCFELLKHYGLKAHPYSSLSEELRNYCISFSNDALYYKDKICYNDKQPKGRIYFSLMHELGHVILRHSENHTPKMEQEANIFASNILAPRMAIHYASCKNLNDVANLFGLTKEAAGYAFNDYRRWHRKALYDRLNSFDQAIYQHFYIAEADSFVYRIRQCPYCGCLIYNSASLLCTECRGNHQLHNSEAWPETELLIAESQWLYGGSH